MDEYLNIIGETKPKTKEEYAAFSSRMTQRLQAYINANTVPRADVRVFLALAKALLFDVDVTHDAGEIVQVDLFRSHDGDRRRVCVH
jgi:hypothetical protein